MSYEELYKTVRPTEFDDLKGQDAAVKILKNMVATKSVPHVLLFCGPSGTGKTSAARILRKELKCSENDFGFKELNCADLRGIDEMRGIIRDSKYRLFGTEATLWLIDEAHRLTPDAQDAALKLLEDTPPHAYFVLATTVPGKLTKTIKGRCTKVEFKALSEADLVDVINGACGSSGKKVDKAVANAIVEAAMGSAREALVLLEGTFRLSTKAEQLEYVGQSSTGTPIDLCRELISDRPSWDKVCNLVSTMTEEPETIRRIILAYMTKSVLNPKPNPRAAMLIDCFLDPYFTSEKAGLALSCWKAVFRKER